MKAIYLKPLGGYKTELRSDTLWGLLCWGLRHLEGENRLKQFIQSYLDRQPELVISSAFPYRVAGAQVVKYFPKPLLQEEELTVVKEDVKAKYRLQKKLKKIYWLDETDFIKALQGKWNANTESFEKQPQKEVETLMHTTIDRIQLSTHSVPGDGGESSGQLYQSPEIYWKDPDDDRSDNTGLFFLVKGDATWLMPVLRLYRHLGFGGNRTTGKGFFEASEEKFEIPEVADANAVVNLSLYHPLLEDLKALQGGNSPMLRYQLEERKGKLGFLKMYRDKEPVTYFKEGSVFPLDYFKGKPMVGNIYEHVLQGVNFPVYDNGVGFFLNMKAQI